MEEYIKIGKSVIQKYYDYSVKNMIDDATEYFPTLKTIINGIVESIPSANEKSKIKKYLRSFSKELYLDMWVKQAQEDEDFPDIEEERKIADKEFEKFFNRKKDWI